MRKQELASRRRAWQPRRSSGRSSATWRPHEQASTGSGGQRHSRRVTRGMSEGRRWRGRCCDGERRRSAARAGGGRRGETRGSQREAGERQGKWGSGTWLGLGQRRGGRVAHMAGQWRRRAAEEKQRRERERGRRRRTQKQFQKNAGTLL
jgi:hypothetical protein